MRASYSLLAHYQRCQFRTKIFDVDRAPVRGVSIGAAFPIMLGVLAHEGQAALVLGQDVEAAVTKRLARYRDAVYPQDWTQERLIARILGMVDRFSRAFHWQDLEPFVYEGELLVDRGFIVKLDPAIGVFTEVAIKPDFVGKRRSTGHAVVYDWKWSGELTPTEAWEHDLQSALYQWGLAQVGLPVVEHAIVQGLMEEPTPFRTNKDGRVSTRAVRNSWEEYEAACAVAGHEPDPFMRDRCLSMFAHSRHHRSLREVEAVWQQVITPSLLMISRSIEDAGFARALDPKICDRCEIRDDCLRGLLGQHEDPAFNTIFPTRRLP